MVIGFDLDDVLLSFQDTMRSYHNATYNTNYTEEHDTVWNLWERWNVTPEESVKRLQDFFVHKMHYDALPLPGSVAGIKKLKENHILYIISAKPESLREKTEEWIAKYFPNMFEKIIFTRLLFDPEKQKKSEVCKKLGIEVFVDDAVHNTHDISEAGIPTLLLDMPWNRNHTKLPPLVTRVFSWEEIVEKLNS